MRRALRIGGLAVAGFVLLQLVFFLLLTAGAAVPDQPIVTRLAQDVKAGTYGPSGLPDRMGGISDTFTECVVVGTGLGGHETNPFSKAGQMPRISNCAKGSAEILRLAKGQPAGEQSFYFRYWAGYTVVTRPVLALFGMSGLRLVSGGLLVAALAAAWVVLGDRTSRLAAAGLLAPLVVSTNLTSTPSTSFSQALAISTYLLGVALVAWAGRRSVAWGLVAVGVAAALFCYVDLLTTPSIGWALSSAALAGVTFVRTRMVRPTLVAVVGAGALWPVSFALTWVSRWLLAIPFAGYSRTLKDVKGSIFFRTEGDYKGVRNQFGAASSANVHYWLDHMATAHVVLWGGLVVAVVGALLSLRRGPAGLLGTAVVALPALCVPFWYEALRNHSQIHTFFVYRCVPAALGVVVFAGIVGAQVALARREPDPAPARESHGPAPAPEEGGPRSLPVATA